MGKPVVTRRIPKVPEKRRGQIIQKGRNKWLVRVFVGSTTVNGQRKREYHSEQIDGTHYQADQKLTQLLRDLDIGTFVPKADQTLGEFLDQWLDTKIDVEGKTRKDYTHRIEKDLKGTPLWRTRLDQVTPLSVQKRITDLLKDPRELSPRTIGYTIGILSQALRWAVEAGLLAKNPCDRVTVPRTSRQEMKFLTPEQVVVFLEANADDHFIALWRLLLTAGLRPQEALALKWEDLSEQGSLMIRRTIKEDEDGHRYVSDELKTEGSRRSIPLSPETIESLEAHRKRQATLMLRRGPKFDRQGFLFANCHGGFLLTTNVRKAWLRCLQAAKLPQVRLYDTRHTHATHLLAAGVHVKAVAARLGHANPTVLLNTYAHVLPQVAMEAPVEVEKLYRHAEERRKAREIKQA